MFVLTTILWNQFEVRAPAKFGDSYILYYIFTISIYIYIYIYIYIGIVKL